MLRRAPSAACIGAVVLAAGCGGGSNVAAPDAPTAPTVTHPVAPRHKAVLARRDPAWTALRLPRVPRGPVPGYVLIADRDNNRVVLFSPSKRVVWEYDGLRGPDDAFFTPGYGSIITNEEFNDTLKQVGLRSRKLVWAYGHAG